MGRLPTSLASRFRTVPAWYADAKLGIFIHWVPASVPGFAPTGADIRELLSSDMTNPISELPYSEWYENSARFPNSSVAKHHARTFGNRPYASFAQDFEQGLDQWRPVDWAERFAAAGARYVVLVAKHHDGWCLWPSDVKHPHRPGWHSDRDLVGELADAVRAHGMRFGLYYSGGYDWTFNDHPIGSLADGLMAIPRGEYVDYADAQVRELIDRYSPSVLWNDIAWPSSQDRLNDLFEYYFEQVADGAVNDRWMTGPDLSGILRIKPLRALINWAARRSIRRDGIVPPKPRFFQFRTPEFTRITKIDRRPWESVRGFDRGFGYNAASDESMFMTHLDLMQSVIGTVANGGNLLLNVGPRGIDHQIPDEQTARLGWLGDLFDTFGEAIYGSRPWVVSEWMSPEGTGIYFTSIGTTVYAWIISDATDAGNDTADDDAITLTLPFNIPTGAGVQTMSGEPIPFTPRHQPVGDAATTSGSGPSTHGVTCSVVPQKLGSVRIACVAGLGVTPIPAIDAKAAQ